jgi:predicted enzyme related to lactoylglutathione lyase
MSKIIHFEISADDPARASEFYKCVFSWRIEKWEGPVDYWLISTDDRDQTSINGAIRQRMKDETTVNTVNVPTIDEFMIRVVNAGGSIVVAKSVVPGVGYHAYCADTEGNLFGIMQQDPLAQLPE